MISIDSIISVDPPKKITLLSNPKKWIDGRTITIGSFEFFITAVNGRRMSIGPVRCSEYEAWIIQDLLARSLFDAKNAQGEPQNPLIFVNFANYTMNMMRLGNISNAAEDAQHTCGPKRVERYCDDCAGFAYG